jgi:hypothetical protein
VRWFPIYILIDSSFYLRGSPIKLITEEVQKLIDHLRQDPNALEAVKISIISYGGIPKVLTPLNSLSEIDLKSLYNINISDPRNLKEGLFILNEDININCKIRENYAPDYDFRPLVMLFVGGDSYDWNQNAKILLRTLSKYTKPEPPDFEFTWDEDDSPDDILKKSIIIFTFNEKIRDFYSTISRSFFLIGKDDLYKTCIKNYFHGFF